MNALPYFMKSRSAEVALPEPPVRETDAKLTPRAEAKVANRLPRAEQLNKFETDLEAHDSGNQPA